jgi:uncharacterized membrane protein YfcA
VTIDPGHAAILVAAGIASGWINTVAGAGGVIAVPALLLWGLPATVANGTLRVAIVAQNIVGGVGFVRAQALPRAGLLALTVPALVGALGGSAVATRLDPKVIEALLLVAFGLVIVSVLRAPRAPDHPPRLTTAGVIGMAIAGFYGGLVQTGVGLVLLAVLTVAIGHDLVAANALKVVVTLAFNIVALVVFALADQVDWLPGVFLALGSMVGALLGVRFAIEGGHAAIRLAVIAITIAAAVIVVAR